MESHREIRYEARLGWTPVALAICVPVVWLGWIIATAGSGSGVLAGIAVMCISGCVALNALVWLVNRALFQKPILLIDDKCVTFTPPRRAWSSVFAPWNDIAHIAFVDQRSARSNARAFTIWARHPHRYASPLAHRLRLWWDPALGNAAICTRAVSPRYTSEVMGRIATTFRREIAQYEIVVHTYALTEPPLPTSTVKAPSEPR